MTQNDEAEQLLNMLHESKAGRDVRNAVAALLRTQAARIAELEGLSAAHKSRGDNHWETMRCIYRIATEEGDMQAVIQHIIDAGSGYMERPEETLRRYQTELAETKTRAEAAEAEVARLREAVSLTVRADNLREEYHKMPNDKNRIGDKRSRKGHARDAWLRAFRKAARVSRAALQPKQENV